MKKILSFTTAAIIMVVCYETFQPYVIYQLRYEPGYIYKFLFLGLLAAAMGLLLYAVFRGPHFIGLITSIVLLGLGVAKNYSLLEPALLPFKRHEYLMACFMILMLLVVNLPRKR